MYFWVILTVSVLVGALAFLSEWRHPDYTRYPRPGAYWGSDRFRSKSAADKARIKGSTVWGSLVGTFLFVTLFAGGSFFAYNAQNPKPQPQGCHHNLVALGTARGGEGTAYLSIFGGSGSFSDYQTVTYLMQRADGSMQLAEVPASEARIFESDDKAPSLVCVNRDVTYDPSYVWPWGAPSTHQEFDHYRFTVPEGSVSRSFTVEP